MYVIVKSGREDKWFKPGYNHSLGKYVHTREDYLKTMKEMKLEPYDPNFKPKAKPKYKPSKWGREMVKTIANRTDKHGNVEVNESIHKVLKDTGFYKKREAEEKFKKMKQEGAF